MKIKTGFSPLQIKLKRAKLVRFVTGFTLLEVLIVVIIIGILAALAIPKFTKTIEVAKGKEAKIILSTIRLAEIAYYMDKGHFSEYVSFGGSFRELVPYLAQDPNGNINRNWNYGFNDIQQYSLARRSRGVYANGIIVMYMNGDIWRLNWPFP